MPGLGLGAGLNRQQQNRFNAAAQGGQGQQWLAAHPNIQRRTAGNAAVQNFATTGQPGVNAAPRFQAGGARAPGAGAGPQGSGATGAAKPSSGGQQPAQQQSLGGMAGGNPQPQQQMNQALQAAQNYNGPVQQAQTPQWWNQNQGQGLAQTGAALNQAGAPMAGGNMGSLMQNLMGQNSAANVANQAGGNSAQAGVQAQNQQQLIQQLMQAFGIG